MATRRDPRYEEADAAIRAAFLGLFARKGIEEITASEVICASGVNRSTFYAHYADKYALLDAVERDFLEQTARSFRESPTMGLLLGRESDASAWEAYFGRLMDFLHENEQLLAGLVGREHGSFMLDFRRAFASALEERGAVSRLGIPTNYESALLAGATAGLVEEWARGGFADDRERVVRLLVNVATSIQSAASGS